MTVLSILNVIDLLLMGPYLAWLTCFILRPIGGFPPGHERRRYLFRKLLWTCPAYLNVAAVIFWINPDDNFFWKAIGTFNAAWSIWVYRKYRDDDDFFNRLRNKAKERIVEVRGKLVIVPLEPIPIQG
jgi:hypothetical protein